MKYMVGEFKVPRGACRLTAMKGADGDYKFFQGLSRKHDLPADVRFAMDDDFPEDIRTEDFIQNLSSVLVVSERTREVLGSNLKNNEFLPITLINHKGRKERGPFYILHQVELQDCIDFERTIHERNAIDPNLLSMIEGLSLDEQRINPEVSLFRLKYFPYAPIFREDLIEKIRSAGLTGLKFTEPALYMY